MDDDQAVGDGSNPQATYSFADDLNTGFFVDGRAKLSMTTNVQEFLFHEIQFLLLPDLEAEYDVNLSYTTDRSPAMDGIAVTFMVSDGRGKLGIIRDSHRMMISGKMLMESAQSKAAFASMLTAIRDDLVALCEMEPEPSEAEMLGKSYAGK
jgi:hypothetical protein